MESVAGLLLNLPERTRDSELPSNIRRLEKSRGPCPLTDDDGGGKTSLNHSAGGAEEGGEVSDGKKRRVSQRYN